jgi:hypothetical protein
MNPGAVLRCSASHNAFIQTVFGRMTAPAGRTPQVTIEFGAGLARTMGTFALYLWTRRGQVAVKE